MIYFVAWTWLMLYLIEEGTFITSESNFQCNCVDADKCRGLYDGFMDHDLCGQLGCIPGTGGPGCQVEVVSDGKTAMTMTFQNETRVESCLAQWDEDNNPDITLDPCCRPVPEGSRRDQFDFMWSIDLEEEHIVESVRFVRYQNQGNILIKGLSVIAIDKEGSQEVCFQTEVPHNYVAYHYIDEFHERLYCNQPVKAISINITGNSTWNSYRPCQADIYGYQHVECVAINGTFYYGPGCQYDCLNCATQCSYSGECQDCNPGFGGPMCEVDDELHQEDKPITLNKYIFIGIASGLAAIACTISTIITCQCVHAEPSKAAQTGEREGEGEDAASDYSYEDSFTNEGSVDGHFQHGESVIGTTVIQRGDMGLPFQQPVLHNHTYDNATEPENEGTDAAAQVINNHLKRQHLELHQIHTYANSIVDNVTGTPPVTPIQPIYESNEENYYENRNNLRL